MRRQWPCSKCGFECASTWRSSPPSKPVICRACSGSKEKEGVEDNQAKEQVADDGTRSSTQISAGNSSSEISTNIATVHGDHHVCRGSSSKMSPSSPLLENIKHENDYEAMLARELEKQSVWDPKSVHKKKRSRLPQYTLSSVERLLHKLHQVETDDKSNITTYEKYDDFLIYEKFKAIPQNEIGLGAKVFYPPMKAIKQEPYTGDEDGSCLFDVPITGPSE